MIFFFFLTKSQIKSLKQIDTLTKLFLCWAVSENIVVKSFPIIFMLKFWVLLLPKRQLIMIIKKRYYSLAIQKYQWVLWAFTKTVAKTFLFSSILLLWLKQLPLGFHSLCFIFRIKCIKPYLTSNDNSLKKCFRILILSSLRVLCCIAG